MSILASIYKIFSPMDHNHDATYSKLGHTHSGLVPGAHTHTKSEITDFAHEHSAYSLIGHDHSGSYSPLGHGHTRSEISDWGHTHDTSEITNLESALSAYAPAVHGHTRSQISDWSHTHVSSEITDLSTALSAYALADHSHAAYEQAINGKLTGSKTSFDNESGTFGDKSVTMTGITLYKIGSLKFLRFTVPYTYVGDGAQTIALTWSDYDISKLIGATGKQTRGGDSDPSYICGIYTDGNVLAAIGSNGYSGFEVLAIGI